MDYILSIQGSCYKQTVSIATTATSALLTTLIDSALVAAGLTAANWSLVRAVFLTCEGNDARVAFGVAAANGGTPLGHILYSGTSMRLTQKSIITGARIIDKTSGSHATIMVTLEY